MSGHGRLLRLGEALIRRACRHLPEPDRGDRYREWTAELPHILTDPGTKLAAMRAARMLLFAADQDRGTRSHRGPTTAAASSAASSPEMNSADGTVAGTHGKTTSDASGSEMEPAGGGALVARHAVVGVPGRRVRVPVSLHM